MEATGMGTRMKIVMDLQSAQSASTERGIGRYSLSLANAIVRNRGDNEVVIALNSVFPESARTLSYELRKTLPSGNIRLWNSIASTREINRGNEWRRGAAEIIREAFLESIHPDLIVVLSHFEGFGDDAIASIREFDSVSPVAVIVYDIIPYARQESHFLKQRYKEFYLRKFRQLASADLLFGISEYTTNEVLRELSLTRDRAVNISSAAEPWFTKTAIGPTERKQVLGRLGVSKRFIFYTGGADEQKNLPRLIEAFGALDSKLKSDYQLVLSGPISKEQATDLKRIAAKLTLGENSLVITGYLADKELVAMYNLCELFVYPSLYEGFGLPVLEAAQCGAPTIASQSSGLPEAVGLQEALFDPSSASDIAEKMERVLTDEPFRRRLADHCLSHSKRFSWDACALTALKSMEDLHRRRQSAQKSVNPDRPRLAFFSPLPPEKSGISSYSAELLPELSRFYKIDVIVAQEGVTDPWILKNCEVRQIEQFEKDAGIYDRLLFHVGNSPFHIHMFDLLRHYPGVVVLHDFFLNNIFEHMDHSAEHAGILADALYQSHGYRAMRELDNPAAPPDWMANYPCNFSVIREAIGVVVHSKYAMSLGKDWYGDENTENWKVIPLLRASRRAFSRQEARAKLRIEETDFVVCSFGFLDPTKLNHRLLAAWLASAMAQRKECQLVFVGESVNGAYVEELRRVIDQSGMKGNVKITGWIDGGHYEAYLAAADAAVQLRDLTRGETSAALFDCLSSGLPTIVNAHGSMAELPRMITAMLPEKFSDVELVAELDRIWQDKTAAKAMGARAREFALSNNSPQRCAEQYWRAIEALYDQESRPTRTVIGAVANLRTSRPPTEMDIVSAAEAIASNFPLRQPSRQLLVDVSDIVNKDAKTGIHRVTRSILSCLLTSPPKGYRVEPVLATEESKGFLYASHFALRMMNLPETLMDKEPVHVQAGDIFIGLDLQQHVTIAQAAYLDRIRTLGARVYHVVYDLLPVLLPHRFPPGMDSLHERWLHVVARYDGAVCISQAVAQELTEWVQHFAPARRGDFSVEWFHLGSDLEDSHPTKGVPDNSEQVFRKMTERPTFLMVGTIEPRKGHALVLRAFETLWKQGTDVNLIIVGQEGWQNVAFESRRTIVETIEALRNCPEFGNRLLWLEDVSDEYLHRLYRSGAWLVAASEGEGFGLPIVEAARHGLPIIARDIPVFHEVAAQRAVYFENTDSPIPLVRCIRECIHSGRLHVNESRAENELPTWRASTAQLIGRIIS
jgi:glycosyltransferase involved in cell wall biosynthesis